MIASSEPINLSPVPVLDVLKRSGWARTEPRPAPLISLTVFCELPEIQYGHSLLAQVICTKSDDGILMEWEGEQDVVAVSVQLLDQPDWDFPPHWKMTPIGRDTTPYGRVAYFRREITP